MLFPSRRITRAVPRTVEPEIDRQYLDRLIADQRGRYLVPIHGAQLIGGSGLVVLPDGCFASESVYERSVLESDPDYYSPPRRPRVVKHGNYFSLLVIWSKNGGYYHWLHDTLQRLFRVVEWLPPDTQYIIPANLRPFQRETLHLLGIHEDQVVPFTGDEVWELEALHFAPATTNSGSHRREADLWLRDKIMGACGITPQAASKRIYVSRRGQAQRRLLNEEAVERYLHELGFETCIPELLPLREQVALFAEAEVVVSTHGSAFANMLFSPPGLIVVDMIEPSMLSWAYVFWAMAEELHHDYWYFLAESVPRRGNQNDTLVSLDKLAATFDRMQLSPKR
jgi:capsular polysaccharide biosynthesis protein